MKRKLIAGIGIAVLLGGCSAAETDERNIESSDVLTAEETEETLQAYAGQTVTGRVESVSGNRAVIRLGEIFRDAFGESGPVSGPDGKHGGKEDGQSLSGNRPDGKPGDHESTSEMQGRPEGKQEDILFVESGETIEIETEEELSPGDYAAVSLDENGNAVSVEKVEISAASEDGKHGTPGFGGSSEAVQGTAAATISEDGSWSGTVYISAGDDENALLIDGASVTLDGITVNKDSGASSNTENGDFYGVNAALLAINGADVTITDSVISSHAVNGNGIFSYGTGTVITVSDSEIITTENNSGGIQTTGGGTTNAFDLTVQTSGNSSAAIRSDRGGGTVNVKGGTYTSSGYNSPAVYSTADITAENAVLTAENSEALVIEGRNSIRLTDCEVTGNMSDTGGASSDINVHNVMIYQSMSGDADVGTSSFSMTGGTLKGLNGDMFYITNTTAEIYLNNVSVLNEDEEGNLVTAAGNDASHGWGTAGQNGAQVTMTAEDQILEGTIVTDSISSLDITLKGNSVFTGTMHLTDNAEGGSASGSGIYVTVEEGSTWILTEDAEITSLDLKGTIEFNGHAITLGDGSVLK